MKRDMESLVEFPCHVGVMTNELSEVVRIFPESMNPVHLHKGGHMRTGISGYNRNLCAATHVKLPQAARCAR